MACDNCRLFFLFFFYRSVVLSERTRASV
uniref:Uncharacterized protein n=1 Tax=Anguilla anguilla TaxID=7936 RepID=A0A0E9W5T9_ANGAN